MTRILQFVGGQNPPLRILGQGADPDNPALQDVVFDSNHASLVVVQKGSQVVASNIFGLATGGPLIPLVRQIPGKRPLFLANANTFTVFGEEQPTNVRLLYYGAMTGLFTTGIGNFPAPNGPGGFAFCTSPTSAQGANWQPSRQVVVNNTTQILMTYVRIRYLILGNTI